MCVFVKVRAGGGGGGGGGACNDNNQEDYHQWSWSNTKYKTLRSFNLISMYKK